MTTLRPLSILLVDDEPALRRLVRRYLDEPSFTFAEAGSGREALDLLPSMPALHLLITDLQMPEMPGDQLAWRVRQADPRLPVLYLTAYAERLFNALAQEGGQVQMPLAKTFFSPRFGMVADRFGVSWMIHVATPAA